MAPQSVDGTVGNPYSAGSVFVALVGRGEVAMSMMAVDFITDSNLENDIGGMRFVESVPEAATAANAQFKVKLPRGFYWDVERGDKFTTTIRTTVLAESSPAGRTGALLVFEHAGRVAIEPTFRGCLVVKLGGTAGAAGEMLLATVNAPAEAEVDGDPVQLVPGESNQALPDIYSTETVKGQLQGLAKRPALSA